MGLLSRISKKARSVVRTGLTVTGLTSLAVAGHTQEKIEPKTAKTPEIVVKSGAGVSQLSQYFDAETPVENQTLYGFAGVGIENIPLGRVVN